MVCQGFHQRSGIDFTDTYAPTVDLAIVRLLLATAISKGYEIRQYDIVTAYLEGEIEEEIYIRLPRSITIDSNNKLKLDINNRKNIVV